MKKNNKRERDKTALIPQHTAKDYIILALYIIAVVALGLLAVNGYLSFRYKVILMADPCGLCSDLNPHLDSCIKEASTTQTLIENKNIKEINLTKTFEELNLRVENTNP